jgi:hypothetical protein
MANESFCRELEATVLGDLNGGGSRRRTMSSSGNGDGPADRRVTRVGRGVGHLDASLEIAAPAPIERRGADEQPRGNPSVSALGYVSADGPARIDDPELKHQSAAIEDFCSSEGWERVTLVRDVQPAIERGLNRPGLSYAIERLGRVTPRPWSSLNSRASADRSPSYARFSMRSCGRTPGLYHLSQRSTPARSLGARLPA